MLLARSLKNVKSILASRNVSNILYNPSYITEAHACVWCPDCERRTGFGPQPTWKCESGGAFRTTLPSPVLFPPLPCNTPKESLTAGTRHLSPPKPSPAVLSIQVQAHFFLHESVPGRNQSKNLNRQPSWRTGLGAWHNKLADNCWSYTSHA